MKGKFLINTLKKSTAHEGITLVCTFSRKIFVPYFFAALKNLSMPYKDIHLLIYDNTQDALLEQALMSEVTPLLSKFKSVRLYKSYLKGRGSISGSGNEMFRISKLYNIWLMWKTLFVHKRGMIYTPLFFQLEDDTIAPPHAFKRLISQLLKRDDAAMVTGIATGRSPYPWFPVRLGVHKAKIRKFKILERHSLSPNLKGVVNIDCSGVYCFAARTKYFQAGFKNYDPYKYKVPFFGMDNVLTWNIKQHGYKILADFSIWCSHLEAAGSRIIAFSKNQAIEEYDIWLPKYNNYAQGIEFKKKHQRARRLQVRKLAPTWSLSSTDDFSAPAPASST